MEGITGSSAKKKGTSQTSVARWMSARQRRVLIENGDIVAVSINKETTLKLFMKMGDTAFLCHTMITVIGVAVGILKRM